MSDIQVVEGTIKPDGSLELDRAPTLNPGRVTVVLQPTASQSKKRTLAETIERIHQGQVQRGFAGRSAEEIDAELQEGDEEYERKSQSLREPTDSQIR